MKTPRRLLQITFSVCIILGSFGLKAQSFEAYNQGMRALGQGNFPLAVEKLREAITHKPTYEDAWYNLGLTYGYMKQHKDAVFAFKKLIGINPNYNPWMYYEATKSLIALNDFTVSQLYAQQFYNRLPRNAKGMSDLHLARNRIEYILQSEAVRSSERTMKDPILLQAINSVSSDYTPQVNPTGTKLFFTSVRKGGFDNQLDPSRPNDWGEDVYFSEMEEGQWKNPELLPPPLNSKENEFGSAFTGDGQTMVYVRCGDEEGVGGCDLYITELRGTEWSVPRNMGNVVNSESWESQPSINADGSRIIFSSTRPGGYGGSDLYLVEKNHLGDWGVPQNLGSTVNTPLNDGSPYIAPDGKTLYFASEGHPGYGGMDVFYSVFENQKWNKPKNLGAPLNSDGDDTNFSISAQGIGYFSSSRLDEDNYEIFEIELPDELKPKPTVIVQGVVSDAETSDPVAALVLLEDINTGELLAVNKSNSASGEYLVVLPAGREYSLSANTEGYFFYSQSFDIPKDTTYQEISLDISLEPIKKGTKVVLNNIFFETGKAELKPISYVELNKAVDLLRNNGTMVIEIGGHTDNVGSDTQNQRLSQKRAESVRSYLVLAGIEEKRLIAKGYGEVQPIESNDTPEGRAANRRTEFVITEF